MKAFYCNFLFLFLFPLFSIAQTNIIEGIVTEGNGTPVPNHEVWAFGETFEELTLSDDAGFFNFEMPNLTGVNQVYAIATIDICTGNQLIEEVSPVDSFPFVIFEMCTGDDPWSECQAFFWFEQQDSDNMLTVSFFPETPEGVINWAWNFGDNHNSTAQNPVHTYTEEGIYEISLTIITADSCSSTFTEQICVYLDGGNPVEDCQAFFWWEENFEVDNTVSFFDESFGNDILLLEWDFGDGHVGTGSNPTHTYAEPGDYPVVLTIFTADSCISTFEEFIWVGDIACNCPEFYSPVCVYENGAVLTFDNYCFAECEGYFNYMDCSTNPEDCWSGFWYHPTDIPLTFQFESEQDPAVVLNYAWDFGDNTLSNEAYPIHEFPAVGEYTVTLTVTTLDSCVSSTTQVVYIWMECNCPDVWEPVCVNVNGELITFSNNCFAECEGYTDFVDCNTIPQDSCLAFIEAHPIGNQTYQFDPILLFPNIGEFIWHFGDGQISNEFAPIHFYEEPGEYIVILEMISPDGFVCSTSTTIYVESEDCICPDVWEPVCGYLNGNYTTFGNYCEAECHGVFDYFDCNDNPTDSCLVFIDAFPIGNQEYQFNAAVLFPDATAFFWDFGDGEFSEEMSPVHFYEESGEYLVMLEVFIANNFSCFVETVIYVEPESCICITIWEPVCGYLNGVYTTFGNSCEAECHGVFDYFDCDTNPTDTCLVFIEAYPVGNQTYQFDPILLFPDIGEFIWHFGDGEVSNEMSPVHFYEEPGEYTVILEMISADGFVCSTHTTIYIEPDGCICPDIWEPVCGYLNGVYTTFGNSCEAECHGVFDYFDCDTNPTDTCLVFIEAYPIGNQTYQFEPVLLSPDVIEFIWHFGDGQVSNEMSPGHHYEGSGEYIVMLEAVTIDGNVCFAEIIIIVEEEDCFCDDVYDPVCVIAWATGEIFEFGNPCYAECHGYGTDSFVDCNDGETPDYPGDCQAFFFFHQDSTDAMSFYFEDLSTGEPFHWAWDFGDGTTSGEQYPQHTYGEPGVYPVSLIVSGENCENTFVMLVFVEDDNWYPQDCQALFLPLISEQNVVFYDLSQGDVVEWHWDFGDGNISSDAHVTQYTYGTTGIFSVVLTIVTADGCTSDFSIELNMEDFNFSGNGIQAYMAGGISSAEDLETISALKVFPNPVKDELNLNLSFAKNGNYTIRIYTVTGQEMLSQKVARSAGEFAEKFDVSQWASGMYFISVQNEKEIKTLKFSKP